MKSNIFYKYNDKEFPNLPSTTVTQIQTHQEPLVRIRPSPTPITTSIGINTDPQPSDKDEDKKIDQLELVKTLFKIIFERFMNERTYAPIRTIIKELMQQTNQELRTFLSDELHKIPGPGPKRIRNKK